MFSGFNEITHCIKYISVAMSQNGGTEIAAQQYACLVIVTKDLQFH